MTALMTSNVFSICPLEGGVAEDGGLKAGVAPGNEEKEKADFRHKGAPEQRLEKSRLPV